MQGRRSPGTHARWTRSVRIVAILSGLGPLAARAQAPEDEVQTPAPATAAPDPVVATPLPAPRGGEGSLPVPLGGGAAAYPKIALERGIEGTVRLRLVVDEEGVVREVEVVGPAGHGFDEVAAAAAWTLAFEPARDAKGRPVAAEIEYAWPFDTSAYAPLSIEGNVREKGARKKIAGATLEAVGPGDEVARTVTDAEGDFRFAGLGAGEWLITVRGPGLVTSTSSVVVPDGAFIDGIELSAVRDQDVGWVDEAWDDYVEVVGQAPTAEVASRTIDRDEVVTLPGSLGDPVRAVQNLPGIARAPFGSGQLLVRGTGPDDTVYAINGVRIPIAFHFSGISTVVSADMLDRVAFHSGNWGVRYGRAIGGVVDLVTDDALPERSATVLGADVFQASGFTRQRLGQDTALVASVRRSYIDTVLNPVLEASGAGSFRAPRFYDAQVRLIRRLGGNGRLSGMFLLSDDRFRVLGGADSPTSDLVGYRTSFQKAQARWVQPLGKGWSVESVVMVGPERRSLELTEPGEGVAADLGLAESLITDLPPDGAAIEDAMGWSVRHEWLRIPGDGPIGVRVGADLQWGRNLVDYDFGEDLFADADVATHALYVEPTLQLGPLQLLPGVRAETLRVTGERSRDTIDPRVTARAELGSFTISGGVGRFSQVPPMREILSHEGAELDWEHAIHASVGVEADLGSRLTVGVTGYRNTLTDLVVGRDGAFRFDNTQLVPGDDEEPFANEGVGGSTGLETLVRYRDDVWTAWVSATIGHAWRIDRVGDDRRAAPYDQPVILTLIGSRALPAGLRFGARARYASGSPMTDIVTRVYSVDSGAFLPIYGDPWSARTPAFFSLDVRLDREWIFRSWRLTTYLEVQNTTNRHNVEIPAWSSDFGTFEPVTGLPILPAFGLKAAW